MCASRMSRRGPSRSGARWTKRARNWPGRRPSPSSRGCDPGERAPARQGGGER
jgi:hypothetical protein